MSYCQQITAIHAIRCMQLPHTTECVAAYKRKRRLRSHYQVSQTPSSAEKIYSCTHIYRYRSEHDLGYKDSPPSCASLRLTRCIQKLVRSPQSTEKGQQRPFAQRICDKLPTWNRYFHQEWYNCCFIFDYST